MEWWHVTLYFVALLAGIYFGHRSKHYNFYLKEIIIGDRHDIIQYYFLWELVRIDIAVNKPD